MIEMIFCFVRSIGITGFTWLLISNRFNICIELQERPMTEMASREDCQRRGWPLVGRPGGLTSGRNYHSCDMQFISWLNNIRLQFWPDGHRVHSMIQVPGRDVPVKAARGYERR